MEASDSRLDISFRLVVNQNKISIYQNLSLDQITGSNHILKIEDVVIVSWFTKHFASFLLTQFLLPPQFVGKTVSFAAIHACDFIKFQLKL